MEGTTAVTSGLSATDRLLAVLPTFDIDGAELCAAVGVDLATLRKQRRVPLVLETALWKAAAARRPEVPFGLAAAERCFAMGIHESSLYEYLGCFAPTLRDAAIAMRTRQRLDTDGFVTTVSDCPNGCLIRTDPVYPTVEIAQDRIEFGMLRMLKEAGRLSGVPTAPRRVALRRTCGVLRSAYERFFGAPVEFGASADVMEFHAGWLDAPLIRANPPLHAELVRIADKELASMAPTKLWPMLLATIDNMISEGDLSAAAVARWLGVSSEDLLRLVRGRGLSWSEVVDSIRRPTAERLLRDPTIAVAEVGYRIGFAAPASFTRAFRRWTGMSPEEFRKAT